ncbi:MAG: sulfur carrier protein ThiS [Agathobacter sp.]|nr:sulfur carrier protein ThiS [Agathobacter sp.]
MIQVNGKQLDIDEITISKLLEDNGYGSQRVAVEVNYEIIPRSQHNEFVLHSGDVIEIVSFVGGG